MQLLEEDPRLSEGQSGNEHQSGNPVAAICYKIDSGQPVFCFVKSSAGLRIFPKGKVKKGEAAWYAAMREAKEEAGVIGKICHDELTRFSYFRPKKQERETTTAFLLEVTGELRPSEKKRDPVWWDIEKALRKFSKKKYSDNVDEYTRVLELALESISLP